MCGIAGIVDFAGGALDPGLVRRMLAVQRHRGPDGEEVWPSSVPLPLGRGQGEGESSNSAGNPLAPTLPPRGEGVSAALGHVRLRIIDLETGAQPMPNEDGSLLLVANGEIYNFRELRAELEGRGHRFRSKSDSEVILHLYEEHGADCLARLEGMFAFALWDARRQTLLLARDRLSVKPLFYWRDGRRLAFASELKALLALPFVPRELAPAAFVRYLARGCVPGPETIFRSLRELAPGHRLILDASGAGDPERWWKLDFAPGEEIPFDAALDRTDELLSAAVRRRLVSDRPLGLFLSGGIDSSLIAAEMVAAARASGAGPAAVRTYSASFAEAEYDEAPHARALAAALGTTHREYRIDLDATAALPRLVWLCEQPFADSSALALYRLAEHAREEVVVALGGDGGDESFAGYERYVATALAGRLDRWTPRFLRKHLLASLLALGGEPARWGKRRALEWVNRVSVYPTETRYALATALFLPEERAALLTPDFAAAAGAASAVEPEAELAALAAAGAAGGTLARCRAADYAQYLPDDLLVKADRMTMAHALELRSPFLDRALVEFAARLPPSLLVAGLTPKRLLRALARRKLPPALAAGLARRRKQGFGVPAGSWFRGALRPVAERLFRESTLAAAGVWRRAAPLAMLEEHQARRADLGPRLWALLAAELWHRTFLGGGGRADLAAPPGWT